MISDDRSRNDAKARAAIRRLGVLSEVDALRQRLVAWLSSHADDPAATVELDSSDVRRCVRAFDAWGDLAEEIHREARALTAFKSEPKPSKKLRAYARERGLDPTPDDMRKHDPHEVLCVYVAALGLRTGDGVTEPLLTRLADPSRAIRSWNIAEGSVDEAVGITADRCGFPSAEACARFLRRERKKLREDRTGWRADFDSDAMPWPDGREEG